MSIWMGGNDATLRPWTNPTSISSRGAWQIAAIGFFASNMPLMKRIVLTCVTLC
jgi:hypothetical protein